MTKWIRHAREAGELIPLKMSFKSGDTRYVSVERLINSLPWGQGNRVLLQALEMGSKEMLRLMQAQATQASAAQPPRASAQALTTVADKPPLPQATAQPATPPQAATIEATEPAVAVSEPVAQAKGVQPSTSAGQAAFKAFRRG